MKTTAEVVIVGGGVVGCSIAYHLRQDGFSGRIVVVERDPGYARASSQLAMGGIRQQFGSAVNIRMVQWSVEFYRSFDERMSVAGHTSRAWFRQRGYLFLVNAQSAAAFEQRLTLERQLGARVERLSVDDIRRMVPDLGLDDIVFGIFGPHDGYANPREVLKGFRAGALAAGIEFIPDEVVAIHRERDRVSGVGLARGGALVAPVVVNAAGPFAARVGEMAGIELPVSPVRQHLFRARLPEPWPYRFPMVIDPTGLHWRHEDPDHESDFDRIVVASTRADEPAGENFACDESRWASHFLPTLERRLPRFAGLELMRGWAGLYEMTPDQNPVLGPHPALAGFFVASGFSGHGLMMAPATGKVMSEWIRLGRAETVDVTPLAADRFTRGERFWDGAMI